MSDEPQKLEYAALEVTSQRNERASISFWMSLCFPALYPFATLLSDVIARAVRIEIGGRLPERGIVILEALVFGVIRFWPIPYSMVSGIRAVREIGRTHERGLWQAIFGLVASSLFALIPVYMVLHFFRRL